MKKKILSTALLAIGLAAGSASSAQIYVRIGPPPPRREVVVARPGPGYVWVAGYHRWDGRAYVWVPGQWVLPRAGYHRWVPGHWRETHRGWVWVEGHWAR